MARESLPNIFKVLAARSNTVFVLLVSTAVVVAAAVTLIFSNSGALRLIRTLPIDRSVTVAALSPDGKFVASADMSNPTVGASAIKVTRIADGAAITSTESVSVYSLVFSPDDNLIAASGNDGLRLFRTRDGYLLRTISADQAFCVAFSSDGSLLAFGGAEGKVRIVQTRDFTTLKTLTVTKWVTSLAFSAEAKTLAVGTSANTGLVRREDLSTAENPIFLFPISGNEPASQLPGHRYGVLTVAFSRDGKLVASGGSDGTIRLFDVSTGRAINVTVSSTAASKKRDQLPAVQHVSFDPEGNFFSAALATGSILFIDLNGKQRTSIEAHRDSVLWTVFTQGTAGFISVGKDGTVRLWKLDPL